MQIARATGTKAAATHDHPRSPWTRCGILIEGANDYRIQGCRIFFAGRLPRRLQPATTWTRCERPEARHCLDGRSAVP